MVVYLGHYDGTSPKNGKEFHRVTLGLVAINKQTGKVQSRSYDYFTDEKLSVLDTLDFGEIVEAVFEESELLGNRAKLLDVRSVYESPYADFLQSKRG